MVNDPSLFPLHVALVMAILKLAGDSSNTKLNPAKLAVPPGVVTDRSPDAPYPTTAVMIVDDTTVTEAAGALPKLTAVAPLKSVPVIVTVVPGIAVVGVNEAITGGGIGLTVKVPGI